MSVGLVAKSVVADRNAFPAGLVGATGKVGSSLLVGLAKASGLLRPGSVPAS